MKKVFLFLLFPPFFAGLGFSQSLSESSTVPANSLVYSLPLTKIEIKVEVVQEIFKAGPYANYADAYMSVEDAVQRDGVSYSIQRIEVRPVVGADYEAMYALPLGSSKNARINFMTLTNEGLIFVNEDIESLKIRAGVGEPLKNFQAFPDRLPSSPMETQKVSSYDRVKTDSGFVHIPYQQSIVNEKDPERKAAEAAKFIYALRQRRFELITGDVDNAFSGSSLKDGLAEINRLEQAYLSLFLGKSSVQKRVFTFYVIPNATKNKSSYNVFRFSESEGILVDQTRGGRPITLDVSPEGRIKYVEAINVEKNKAGLLFYRVPETALVQLMDSGKEICSGSIPVYQMGKVFSIPVEMTLQ